jgi:hypothetical protein
MLEMVRARRASRKGAKLVGTERYSEASFVFTNARDLYRKVGDYEKAAVACIEAKAAMKLAQKQSRNGAPSAPPSSELQAVIIERWNARIHEMIHDRSGVMTLTVANEKKLAHKG